MSWIAISLLLTALLLMLLLFARARQTAAGSAALAQGAAVAPMVLRFDAADPAAQAALAERANRFGEHSFDALMASARDVVEDYPQPEGMRLGFNESSLLLLENVLENQREREDITSADIVELATALGGYLGYTMVASGCGMWHWHAGRRVWCISQGHGEDYFPFDQIQEQLVRGIAGGASTLLYIQLAQFKFLEKVPARLLNAVAEADRLSWNGEWNSDEQACLRILHELTLGATTVPIRLFFGTPIAFNSLIGFVPAYRLKSLAQMCQRLLDLAPPRGDPSVSAIQRHRLRQANMLMALLVKDEVVRLAPTTINGKLRQIVELPDAPRVLSRGQVRKAVRAMHLVQFRLRGETEQRIGRVMKTWGRETVVLRSDTSGESWTLPYHAVVMDGLEPAQDLVEAALLAHPADGTPLTEITVEGFDPAGEPVLRMLADGSMEIVFNFMPPLFAKDPAPFDSFDATLAAKLDVAVEWQDREVFRIAQPQPDSVARAIDYLGQFHVVRGSYAISGQVDDDL